MYGDIYHFVASWLPDYARDNRNYLTVAIGCTGGQHRSVYLAERLARRSRGRYQVLTRHRELPGKRRGRRRGRTRRLRYNQPMTDARTITLAFTGASGLPYGLRLLECLLAADARVYLALLARRAGRRAPGARSDAAHAAARGSRLLRRALSRAARAAHGVRPRGLALARRLGLEPRRCDGDLPVQHGHRWARSRPGLPTT